MIDLREYSEFVEVTTSKESKDLEAYIDRLYTIAEEYDVNVPLLLTAAAGLSSEGGEFHEIVKKVQFQGKALDHFHLMRELGDIMWYWCNACIALDIDPYTVIQENITKLKARYPDGKFDAYFSENRKHDDI